MNRRVIVRRRPGMLGWFAAAYLAALVIRRNLAVIALVALVPMVFVAIAANPNW